MTEPKSRFSRVTLLLVLIPLWLVASGGVALWYYFHHEKKTAAIEQERFVKSVSVPLLADDLRKIVEIIGERNASSESAAKNLSRMASMIQGTLGPANTGYSVKSIRGPAEWPIFQVTLRGKNPDAPAVWVVTSYDSPQGSRGAEANASGLAAAIAAAQAMAGDTPECPVHFVFLPHANDTDSPVLETATALVKAIQAGKPPKAVLCVEAMGSGETLWLSSRDTEASPLRTIEGLGKVYGADVVCLGEDSDSASVLFEMGLPAVRVATRATLTRDESDDRVPFAPTVAAATGRLVELVRRCAVP